MREWIAASLVLCCAGAVLGEPLAAKTRVGFVSAAAPQPHASDKAVIFFDDFEQSADLRARYFEYGDSSGSFVWTPDADGSGAMKCQFEKGQVSAGGLKVLFGRNPLRRGIRQEESFREIYWRVYVKHEEGWEGNPAKLARATCLAGRDWSQGLIAHVWGGRGAALCIDPATGIRDSRKVSTKYNDFKNLRWLGLRHGRTPIFDPSESGRWVCVESRVRLNSPGRRDGVFALWVDGRLEAMRDDLDWHGTWQDYAINAVFIENYWNTGSIKRQARYFDNFVISTQPIGPIVAARVPSFTRTRTKVSEWEAQVCADSDGRDVVWRSRPMKGETVTVSIDAAGGEFAGPERVAFVADPAYPSGGGGDAFRAGRGAPAPGVIHWLRLRERGASGAWSDWTECHAPFRAAK